MQESLISDLYLGNFIPCERKPIRTEEYCAISGKISDIVEHFEKLLSPEEYAKFTEMQDLRAKAASIEEEELFEYAFCAGARLMTEVFTYKGI